VRIDVHAHLFPEELPDFADRFGDQTWPTLERADGRAVIHRGGGPYRPVDHHYWSAKSRIDFLDGRGIDHQVVSPLPVLLPHWAPEREAAEFCAWQNEAIARHVATHPDRLSGLGTVPVQHPDAAARELDHVAELGLVGVEIGTTAAGAELDGETHRQFFDAAADRGISVLLHPLEGEGLGRMDNPVVRFSVGVLADTGVAATFLLLSEAMRRRPDLRLCLSHGGGAFFWALPRLRGMLDRFLGAEEAAAMVDAMRGVWVDTASMGPPNLRYLEEVLGRDRIVLGSDYPATADVDPLEHLVALGWDSDDAVMAGNARAFLGVRP